MLNVNKIREQVKALLTLMRMRNCVIASVGVLLGASFINLNDILAFNVLLAVAAVFLITGAGNTINDYFDYEIDKINKAHRPIPSNKINRSDALMFSFTLFFIGIGVSNYINDFCLGIAVINSVILLLYGKYSKRLHVISNLGISYLVASVFLFGALANSGSAVVGDIKEFQLITAVSACAFFATFSREIIKDIEDIEGDKRRYSVTLPIQVGVRTSRNIAFISILAAILFSAYPFFIGQGFNLLFYGIFILIADMLFLISWITHPALGQRLMVVGMVIALTGFFLGRIEILF